MPPAAHIPRRGSAVASTLIRLPSRHSVFLLMTMTAGIQILMVYHATGIHSSTTAASINTTPTFYRPQKHSGPRILIGIIGNANNHMGKIYRWRHRKLITIWNDTRLCSLDNFEQDMLHAHQSVCKVLYTFVVGAFNATSGMPTHVLDDSRPMTVPNHDIAILPRFRDINNTDVTLLNIAENMNDGKTPTFVRWAHRVAKEWGIPYIVKCDSDAILRWNALWQFIHQELPWPSSETQDAPMTVFGAFRHKALWNESSDETFWRREYHDGTHLYLAGQLYGMSTNVARYLIREAEQYKDSPHPPSYSEGHEDHDATGMIQVQTSHLPIRWLSMPRHNRFWEHPVKGDFWWKRILKREEKKVEQGKRAPAYPSIPTRHVTITTSQSLLILLGATTREERARYQSVLKADNPGQALCPISQLPKATTNQCDIYYVFIEGTDPAAPTEVVLSGNTNKWNPSLMREDGSDVWKLPLKENIHEGMAISVLWGLTHGGWLPGTSSLTELLDWIVFVQTTHTLNLTRWQALQRAQTSSHALLLGDLRDKYQEPREFPGNSSKNDAYWWVEYENIHLYLGSDCLAIGTNLVAGMVEQAFPASNASSDDRSNIGDGARIYFVGNLGHDLTTLAYFVPKRILHWIPIPKSLQFWKLTMR